MKKIMAMILVGAMMLGCVACGNAAPEETSPAVEVTSAEELLQKVWDTYEEDEKFYAMGGHYESPVDNAPGTHDLAKAEDLSISYCIPQDAIAMVDDAATLRHAMNSNNFTGAAYHVSDPANMQELTDQIKEATMSNQWMCGFPETLIIAAVGDDYLVTAYGSADIIELFKTKLTSVYGDAVVISVEESIE